MIKRVLIVAISLAVAGYDLLRHRLGQWLNHSIPPTGVILYYHAIRADQRKRFARQMDTLLAMARPFSAASFGESLLGGRHAAVTFDDGFRSVVENAVPELEQRNIPFAMFVPSGSLGARPSWVKHSSHPSWSEEVLTASELRSLSSMPLATIGSHSITHPNMLRLDQGSADYELRQSRDDLERVLGKPIELFSFPHGAFNNVLLDQARRAGYRRVFTIEPKSVEMKANAFAVGRVSVEPDDWLLEFRLKIAGAYRWRSYVKELIRHQDPGPSAS
jgi:peptidoglycan/xylan/chitin deacetylase (PgdA/CDA1 family)